MKEIKVSIPDGTKKVTIEIQEDGTTVTQYEKPEVKVEEQKFEPKDGDILFGEVLITKNIIIYKGTAENGAVVSYAGATAVFGSLYKATAHNKPDTGFGHTSRYTRYATEEEKQILFDALAKEGKRWNAETKQIEDLPRWRAKKGGAYYYISENKLEVDCTADVHGLIDDNYYNFNNYFKTREAAERVAEQIREIFKKSKAE